MFDAIQPEDVATLQKYLAGRFTGHRRRFEFEVRTRKPADAPRWLILRGLIVYADGRPIRLVGSLADITDRKRAEEEVILHREALYQSEKMAMFGSLLAGVAHELNNPLSTVIGQTVLLQQTVADPAVLGRGERIRNAAERCARIVRTFLAMARQRHAEPKPVEINKIIETAVELLAYQLRSANIRVELDLAEDLPMAMADADQIHQVLMNLIINARQALLTTAKPGLIRIETHLDSCTRQIEISVTDNGPGVPPELRKRIFDPFFTTKPTGEGTGIGLSLCSSIMRAHGGCIDASDAPGGGAMFTILLPLGIRSPSVQDETDSVGAPVGLRILIVDDEAEVVDTLSEILRSKGHEIDIAADGQQALERALSVSYDMILSDMRMPLLDGPGFYQTLHRDRPDMLDRFAFITGDTLSPEIRSFLNRTGAPCLEKPFLPEDVLRLLSQVNRRVGRKTRQWPILSKSNYVRSSSL
jgi:signal transduction histidine kinase/CheY-like chemotaxis protein